MINKITIENFGTFKNNITLNLEKDNYTDKFPQNITSYNTLKSAVIFGPNNTGKSTIIDAISVIKNTLLNYNTDLLPNIFNNHKITKFSIKFYYENNLYEYEFSTKYGKEILYEKFSTITNNKSKTLLLKDSINKIYKCSNNKKLENLLPNTSNNNILIYTLNTDNFNILKDIKTILTFIANNIEIINMNNIPNEKTIEILKNKDKIQPKIVEFIKNADIFLDDYYYDESASLIDKDNISLIEDKSLKNQKLLDQMKLVSVYKGIKVPSILFDSLGTRKIVALASYVIEAINNGKTLFIDELDSSLHFKITRSIINLFNNILNKNAQLICTLHDISLLDCQKLFRKDQIWFTDKKEDTSTLYSLKEFSYAKTSIRDTSDIKEKYNKGLLGAIPEPNLINALLEDTYD